MTEENVSEAYRISEGDVVTIELPEKRSKSSDQNTAENTDKGVVDDSSVNSSSNSIVVKVVDYLERWFQ